MKDFEIDGYIYICDGVSKPIPNAYIQPDSNGLNKLAVRKTRPGNCTTEEMFSTFNRCKYYIYPLGDNGYIPENYIPVTWTNNPFLREKEVICQL